VEVYEDPYQKSNIVKIDKVKIDKKGNHEISKSLPHTLVKHRNERREAGGG